MKTVKEKKANKVKTMPKNVPVKAKKSLVKDTDAEGSSPYVDLDKANFAERTHGRTARPLGPDHEPGTV